MLERSTLHRVLTTEQERYSVAFFLDGDPACMIECLESVAARKILQGFQLSNVLTICKAIFLLSYIT
ncbi:Isopenicillin N synthase-like protein [Dioscorea alata]|uniref:Isopenicillin N synthase-like protein n=1 Tax=Dioscorea alata TaxID=55571 RepID=A0ACB7VIN5_DIOAL|nr:Isopenicillin N synthase-like protein [Dioscorea alata]